MDELDRRVVDFAGRVYRNWGAREAAIKSEFGWSQTVYFARLGVLLDDPGALEYAPMTVLRLRRLRDERRARRAS